MGFLHQMSLLLWKNFTLKKRSPFVLLFELFIPLVLFVILLFIRKRQPPHPQASARWSAHPLPSSGAIPILQLFCENNQHHNASHITKEESTYSFLTQLQSLGTKHHFFYPGYTPSEMERLPAIYKSIIDSPSVFQESFHTAKNFKLGSLFTNNQTVVDYLQQNVSMPHRDVDVLIHSTVNVTEVYRLLFGSYPEIPDHLRVRRSLEKYKSRLSQVRENLDASNYSSENLLNFNDLVSAAMSEFIPNFQNGLIRQFMNHSALWGDKRLVQFVLQFIEEQTGSMDLPHSLTPVEIAELLKLLLLSPEVLHSGACNAAVLPKLLIPQPPYNTSDLVKVKGYLCNLTDDQFDELSDLLKSDISDDTIVQLLNIHAVNISSLTSKVHAFLEDVDKFYTFQTTLYELSVLAEVLPQDGCEMMSSENATETPPTSIPMKGLPDDDSPEAAEVAKKNKFAGLIKIWDTMQKTFCGYEPPHTKDPDHVTSDPLAPGTSQSKNQKGDGEPEGYLTTESPGPGTSQPNQKRDREPKVKVHRGKRSADDEEILEENFDDLGLNSAQEKNLKILIHVLYSNPKILYAPNNTGAMQIIKKANATFELVDTMNKYAREWLNISSDLRDYLMMNSTKHNLQAVKQIQTDLKNKNTILSIATLDSRVGRFVNLSIPDVGFFLHEIDAIDNAACTWLTLMSGINLNVFKGFSQEYELVDFFLTKQYHQNVSAVAGVVFDNVKANESLPTHIRYKIRQNATFTPTTKRVRDRYWYPGPGSSDAMYYNFGFLWVQDIIERAIISVQVGRDVVEPGSYMHRFPYPCWLYDRFVFMIEHVMPLCLTISWVYSVAMLVQSIVHEKELRLKEVMKMMGLSNAVHWLAWFITTFIQFSVTMGILTAMLKYGRVLAHSNPLIVFFTLEVFAIATISFCFLISTLYSKAKVAAACAGIVYFLTYVPYMYVAIKEDVAGDSISSIVKTLVSLFSTTAFGLGGKYFAFYEEEGVGVQWNNIYISPVEDDQFNLLMVILMMILDAFLYAIIAWYIENVFPGSYGLPKPWYFPFTKSYWCGGQTKIHEADCGSLLDLCRRTNGFSIIEEDQACAMARNTENASNFEAEPSHLARGVCIDNLTKVYKTGKKLAVKNLSLNLYEEQITSFLGHNGAGKTTTMSILTGLFPPSSGSATIYGHDIRTDMEVIRQGLGMCPQHNVLFDKLTVEEHLWFYARLKGMKNVDINTEMDTMFEDLGLPKKRKSRIDCLSGGMQRKLSVAIAFVGGSRTVILDEPTAGVDPYARRAIWDLLLKYKHGRTILLSTHHMDEADLLGDRIAIISNGELKCCGSSLFLKNTFCEGYHLYLVKKEKEEDVRSCDDLETVESSQGVFTSKCEESKVTEFIQKHVLTAYLKSETRRELHYILPYEEAKKGNFEKLFQALEEGQDSLHISSHGVADSTLEEVFLQVTETASKESIEEEPKPLENIVKAEDTLPSPLPLAEMLDQAAGGQSETSEHPANEKEVSDLEMNSLPVPGNDENDPRHNVLEMGDISENTINLQTENQANREKELDLKNFEMLSGKGSYTLSRKWLLLNHFRAVIVKRFHYITRNWKGLFSQILLPALFVSVAMTVALSAPKDEDQPPLELSPSQYFNLTQPVGNYIPFSNEYVSHRSEKYLLDAGPSELIQTFHLPSGVGATCVLKTAFNSTLDEDIFRNFNVSHNTLQLLSKYYEDGCERVFVPGIHLENYVPAADIIPNLPNNPDDEKHPGPTLWKSNMNFFPNLKWQYFISVNGIHNEYPGNAFEWSSCSSVHDTRHREVYVSTMQPQSKHVIIMMDHGNSLSNMQVMMAKTITKSLISSFTENDKIAVIGLAADVSYPRDDMCVKNSLVPVTFETKFFFNRFIDSLEKQDVSTNHSLGFLRAFQMIGGPLIQQKKDDVMIIYISRGLLSSLTEAKDVMEVIASQNGRRDNRIIINTYAVIDNNKPIMYEKSFLQDIAKQNFTKYNVKPRSKSPIRPGIMEAVNSTLDLSLSIGNFFLPFNKTTSEEAVFSLPYIDNADRALTMSISQPCLHNQKPIGISGVDLYMEDLVQDITYYNKGDDSYVFLVNKNGYTIMHPSFTRPIKMSIQPMHTDIWHYENVPGFEEVRSNILRRSEGEQTLYVKETTNTSGVINTYEVFYAKYMWKMVENTPYIMVMKITQKQDLVKHLNNHESLPDLVYHRLDIMPTNTMCMHLKQLATTESSTVFLSANSFINPFEHLSQGINKRMVQSYVAYMKDDTRLISNPGLKDTVRNDVAATAGIDKVWKRRFQASELKDYIIRRFITTPSGVFRSYPGALFDETYDPTKQPWYERAMKYPGQVVLTAPYLDVGGAGYIVTISHTVFEGQAQSLHSANDKIVAVMGMDLTLGYFYKMLLDNIAVCKQSTVRCFLLNDDGYMIAHPTLIEPDGRGPVEEQHITHKEPLVANDILNHRHFVHKKLCNRYNDRTVQRYYTFNTSLDEVLTNLVHGEHCAKYQIVAVPGTNIFLGMINHTCDLATAFCPCSMLDRLCLNCNRMGPVECECPCECPLAMDLCNGDLLKSEDMNPSCPRFPEQARIARIDSSITNGLKQCNQIQCDSRTSQMSCLGVVGCEWCQAESEDTYKDGMEVHVHKALARPFCGSQATCFGGVIGAPTPYGDRPLVQNGDDEEPLSKSAPVGPVAGGIMGCFLVLALGVYCYRHRIHRNSLQYISTLPENPNRHSNFYEGEDLDQAEDNGYGHTNFVLATFEHPASISPYRVNTSYRRPAGGDSDHGYSTMTPHDESEHASLPCLEPLIVGNERYKPGTYSVSKTPVIPPPPSVASRRSRSPTPPQTRLSSYQPIPELDPSQTVIDGPIRDNPHSVIANVQVHMVDTH